MRQICFRYVFIFPLLLSLLPSASQAQSSKSLTLPLVEGAPVLDGNIDTIWSLADSVSDFEQQAPYHGKAPSRKTVAKVLSTRDALYCLFLCYDKPENIQRHTGLLDQMGGDIVSIMLDTFGDKKTAYKFAVSASGARNDCRLLDDARNRDYGWDGVWFSEARIFEWGFAVEMEIPYRSIQYDESLSSWGLDFDRWMPLNSEDLYWCRYEESEGQRISKFGTLRLDQVHPSAKGLNLEMYPVGFAKADFIREGVYHVSPDAGIDMFYNPSPSLTFQLTGNPDFAQIEADPFEFNISRYETYYNERRPFFSEGNEIFAASGREQNSGFYRPLELFYSRRIGKKLADGSDVPLQVGSKVFGRVNDWEYGAFVAKTGAVTFMQDGNEVTEPSAVFVSARIKQSIFENSSVGGLFVGKFTNGHNDGLLDIDGAIRSSNWQLAYQFARSMKDSEGDFATSIGFRMVNDNWIVLARSKAIGSAFDVDQIGYVPWKGVADVTFLTGPRWYFAEGELREILMYFGGNLTYEHADLFTDRTAVLGWDMGFRSNWGYEVNFSLGKSIDREREYTSYDANTSCWFNISPTWNASAWAGYSRTYNFYRNWLGFYAWVGSSATWKIFDILSVGTSADSYFESKPDGSLQDVTLNARPYCSLTPINDLNVRMYFDNVFTRSSDRVERTIFGLLVSYNFLPKSWIYLAINDYHAREDVFDSTNTFRESRLRVADRSAVLKIKYLYYL